MCAAAAAVIAIAAAGCGGPSPAAPTPNQVCALLTPTDMAAFFGPVGSTGTPENDGAGIIDCHYQPASGTSGKTIDLSAVPALHPSSLPKSGYGYQSTVVSGHMASADVPAGRLLLRITVDFDTDAVDLSLLTRLLNVAAARLK